VGLHSQHIVHTTTLNDLLYDQHLMLSHTPSYVCVPVLSNRARERQ